MKNNLKTAFIAGISVLALASCSGGNTKKESIGKSSASVSTSQADTGTKGDGSQTSVSGSEVSVSTSTSTSNGKTGPATDLNVLVFNGTGGKEWVTEAAKRFKEANASTSFQDGKNGVNIQVTTAKDIDFDTEMQSSGYDIYIYETKKSVNMYSLSAQNYLLDLSDIVEPLIDKIEPDLLERMKGYDGKYYGLPHYEWFPGLTYDVDLFNEKCLYFADPSVDSADKDTYNRTKFGSAAFIGDSSVKKSVGPNGVSGDYDDGLPSSLQEFCILCDKMVSLNISPMILCGSGHAYSWYLPIALWASLTGGDGMRDVYCNWTDEQVDVATGWSSDSDLFYSGSSIKKPTTTKMSLNDDNGYQMYSMANRYYALAFFELALKENWINTNQLAKGSAGSAAEAQTWFVIGNGGKRNGMLWDGSYWCHEAANVGTFNTYSQLNPTSPDRHTAFMPLPTQLEGSVTEGKGKKPTLLNVGSTMVFANAKTAKNGTDKAAKEFIKFIYSDSELAAFSEKTGLTVPMDYSYDMSKLNNSYYSSLATYRKDADVIQCASSSTRFKKNLNYFVITYDMTLSNYTVNGTRVQSGYLSAFRNQNATAKDIFDATKIAESTWTGMSK